MYFLVISRNRADLYHSCTLYERHTLRKLAHAINKVFRASKIEKFQLKKFDIFLSFAQNIDCGYALEPSCRGGSNEYPQFMFWRKKIRKIGKPFHTPMLLLYTGGKSGVQGVYITRKCFRDVSYP